MEILIASANIIGSVVILGLFGFVVILFSAWELTKNQKQALEEASLALAIRVEDLDKEEHLQKLLKYFSEKFSPELFRNRFSDFCGFIRSAWVWLSNIVQAVILIAVLWYTITDDTQNAVYAWSIVGVAIFSFLVSIIFSLTCKLLTGRYPGQAKVARKVVAEWAENNGELLGA